MKLKHTSILLTCIAVLAFLPVTSMAQATVIFSTANPGKAVGITDLNIEGTLYNVAFDEQSPAVGIYGDLPGVFSFTTANSANAAVTAVVNALNGASAQRVGEEPITVNNKLQLLFAIAYSSTGNDALAVANTYEGGLTDGAWLNTGADQLLWIGDERTYATFTMTGPGEPSVPTAPTGVMASDGEFADKVNVTWNAVSAATVYRFFRCTDDTTGSCGGTPLAYPKGTSFDDKGGVAGTVYSYRVKACTPDKCSAFSALDTGFRNTDEPSTGLTAPTDFNASDGEFEDGVHLSWNAVDAATVYRVFICTDDTQASCGSPVKFPTATNYVDKSAVPGTTYTYRVKACTPDKCSAFSALDTGFSGPSEPVVGNVSIIAAEGDTLPDSTLLSKIVSDGGVAINIFGQVAFGGRDDDNTISVFTQGGQAAKEASTLNDGTFVEDISPFGEVAINAGQSGDMVAFLGRTDKDRAVFTNTSLVVAEGGRLPDGTLVDEIRDEGKVAINDFDLVAFHGKSEVGDGLSKESFQAVFTSDALAAREGSGLDDGTTLQSIDETGGVAINDFGEVAFHGEVIDPDFGTDGVEAVFTQFGMVARREGRLPDGTIVSDIDENGGIAINMFGEVAFHGDVLKADTGTDTVRAVFTQLNGPVAREGFTLPDGTLVDEIFEIGGVAINFFGDVVFHGRTGSVNAVFTQNGLVAKEGDSLDDGTILSEIHPGGGVAINFFGEVAFHGKVGSSTDLVLVGEAPVPSADSN
jgi:hypothetical protein